MHLHRPTVEGVCVFSYEVGYFDFLKKRNVTPFQTSILATCQVGWSFTEVQSEIENANEFYLFFVCLFFLYLFKM